MSDLLGLPGKPAMAAPAIPTMIADVFAIGLLAYRLFARQMPSAKATRPGPLNSELPAALEKWTMRCLASNPILRPVGVVASRAEFFAAKKAA